MPHTVNVNSDNEIVKAQLEWLKNLQNFQKKSPILIKALEGKTPEKADSDLYRWLPYPNIWYKIKKPIYTRGILQNEILIDPDTPEWETMKEGIEKLLQYCRENHIPYISGFSGGKGVHVSIFYGNVSLDTDLIEDINKTGIDVYKTVRRALIIALSENAGVDLDEIRMDWGKINFNIESKGSQVRTFGTVRAPGQYKTLIEEIPDHKPEPNELPLVFPEKIELWEIEGTEYEGIAKEALKKEVERAKKANEYVLNDADFSGIEVMTFPCIKRLFGAGIKNGRYYAGLSVLLMCKKCGISKEDTKQHLIKLFETFPGITQSETNLRIDNALTIYDSDKNFSCRKLKEDHGEEFCNFAACPLKEKIEDKKADDIVSEIKKLKPSPDEDIRLNQVKDFVFQHLLDFREDKAEELIFKICKIFNITGDLKSNVRKFYKIEKKAYDSKKQKQGFNLQSVVGSPMFDLEKVTGRGEAYKILTEKFLLSFDPVITFADNEDILIYKDGIYSNMEGSAKFKIDNYITEELALKKYHTCLSPNHTESIIKKIKARTHVLRSEVDKDPFKIAVKNGILDVRTGEISKPTPQEYFTTKIDIEYNPNIKPVPEFEEYLNSTFKEVEWQIPVMQELMGYCLYRAYPYEYLVFFTGDGRNGKGVFFQLMGALVGKHNVSSIPLDEIVRKQSEFTLCDLYGKMINLCGEIGKTRISETRDIKMLTGKDDCRARFPHQKGFIFRNYAKMFFSMNEPPEIEDFTTGMKNRIKIYDFPNVFITGKNAIDDLEEKLTTPEALTGMLNWALEGLHRLLKNKGKLSDRRSAAQMGVIYEKKSRPMYYFVRDCIEEDPNGMVLRERLEEAYVNYAKRDNLPTLSKENIRKKLTEECNIIGIKTALKQIYKSQLSKEDQDNEAIAARPRVYTGIRILPEEPKKPKQSGVMDYNGNNEGGDDDLSEFSQARKDIIAFAKGPYNGVVEDIEAFVTDFMKNNNGYKNNIGRETLTEISTKARSWGWTN